MSANDDNTLMSANGDRIETEVEARLPGDAAEIQAVIDDLQAFQDTHSLRGLSVRQMIEEGRNR